MAEPRRKPAAHGVLPLGELVSAAAVRNPKGVAIVRGGQRITFEGLDRAVAALALELADRGVEPGDRVAVLAGTGIEFAVALHGVMRAGGAAVPLSPASPPAEAAQLLRHSRAVMVVSDRENEELAWSAAELYDERCGALAIDGESARGDTNSVALKELVAAPAPEPPASVPAGAAAVVLFTSGSEATPKGVVHSHEGLMWNCMTVAREMLMLRESDAMLGALPLAHSFGLSAVLNASLLAGCRLELMPRFDAGEAWKLIADRGVTVVTGVPTMYQRLASHTRSSRNTDLRLGVVSGSSCPPEVATLVRQRMGISLVERYGMTEVSPLTWREHGARTAAGDVGRPGWGVRIRARDKDGKLLPAGKEGELEVRAPGMMMGYLDAATTAAALHDGWLRTGDLGQVRADGGVTLSGRLKDVILRGGYTVSARQVEAAILRHPAVAEAAVVGVADPELGEEIAAAVVIKARKRATEDELRAVVADHLATYKRPRLWRIVEEIPRTSLGKVRKDRVREMFTAPEATGD